MKYRWLLLDADGTIFDYDKAEQRALQETFKAQGRPFEPAYADHYRRINAQMWRAFEQGLLSQDRLRALRFEQLLAEIGHPGDADAFSTCYLERLSHGVDLIAGAEEVIGRLHGRVGMIIITNGIASVQRPRLARCALSGYFLDVIISEEVGAAKPDRRIFDVAFEKMGQPAREDVLIVGDSLTSDIQGGCDYGIDTCWFNPDRDAATPALPITHRIGDLAELLPLLEPAC